MMLFAVALLASVVPAQAQDAPQAFRLESGDYHWVKLTVKHVPTEVDCRFEVLRGGSGVDVELLGLSEFRLFRRGREYRTLAVAPNARSGAFRRVIERPGEYSVVVKNAKTSPPAIVSLDLSLDANPRVAQELPARRRLVVILISFAVFFAIVLGSGLPLIRALRRL